MPKKILLADDSITIQKVVELTFSDGDYEVTAVNNGAKAVQKLSEMRPDIILSDIIMPEKNGYEVCEYVKSHPDFRNIPVVLLTGTFEPFDPDRAEKAGCDAVVTKPFESQSLIHKVDELIAQTRTAAPEPAPAEPQIESASPWMEEPATPSGVETGVFTPAAPAFTHDADIFGAPPATEAAPEMPFEAPSDSPFGAPPPPDAFSAETRAFPRVDFGDFQSAAPAAAEPRMVETPSWPAAEEQAPAEPATTEASAWSDEPQTFEQSKPPAFGSLEAPQPATSSFEPQPEVESTGFEAASFDTFDQGSAASSEPPVMPPWNEPEPSAFDTSAPHFREDAPAFGAETQAFPKMSFDDLQANAPEPQSVVPSWSERETPAFGETPVFGSEAGAFDAPPPASPVETQELGSVPFEEYEQPASSEPVIEPEPLSAASEEPAAEPLPWDEEPTPPSDSFWSPAAERPSFDTPSESFSNAAAAPFASPMPEDLPSAFETPQDNELGSETEVVEEREPEWAPAAGAEAAAEAAAEPEEPVVPPPALVADAPPMPIAAQRGELTDEQIDRIARRVVELMSEKVVRNIAWEVIPDMAEMVVKERIRQLESEA